MKKALFSLILFALSSFAFASDLTKPVAVGTSVSGTNGQQQQQASTSGAVASTSASQNAQIINFNSPGKTENDTRVEYSGTQTLKNVPNMTPPTIMTNGYVCEVPVSGAIAIAGFGGGYGQTVTDKHCRIVKSSAHLQSQGMGAAAMVMNCFDKDMNEALRLTGWDCPQNASKERQDVASATPVSTGEACYAGSDPIVLARNVKTCK